MSSQQVEAFRRNLGLVCNGNQGRIAASAGISRVFLNRIIRGHATPTLPVAFRIAEALGTTVDTLTEKNLPSAVDRK